MRRSGWVLPIAALLLWIAAAAYPGVAAIGALTDFTSVASAPADAVYEPIRPIATLLIETTAYALLITVGALVLGWGPGRLLGRALRGGRGYVPLAAMLLAPICLPAYAVFYTWWQLWPPNSALHAWAVGRDLVAELRQATLLVGLICWSWPIVSWCVAGSVAMTPAETDEMLALDGAGWWRRRLAALRSSASGLAVGGLVVFVVVFDNTTCFDLAQIFTYGNELRAKDALGATSAEILRAAAPAILVVTAGAVAVWVALAGRGPGSMRTGGRAPGRFSLAATAGLWVVTVLLPLALLAGRVGGWNDVEVFVTLYGSDLIGSVIRAVVGAGLGAIVAIGMTMAWLDHRAWVRAIAHGQAIVWLIMAFVPATVAGVAIEAAYNTARLSDLVYRREAILVVASLARFGFVAALLARWAATREPATLADLRRTDDASGLAGIFMAARPRLLAAGVAAGAIIMVLALGEVAVTARVNPPGSQPLVMALLNDMHYQRPQTVLVAVLLLFAAALGVAVVVAAVWAGARRLPSRLSTASMFALMLALPFMQGGCTRDPGDVRSLEPDLIFGTIGTAMGQFSYPRAMAVDGARGYIYVIDKTARVQRFGFDGIAQTQWSLPAKENGKPTGVSVAPDGRVFVADTHYFRIIAYDPDGNELMRFGSYGDGPGQFIYPTCVAFAPDGRLFVAEYGGHDRIQIFSPKGEWLSEFGSFGAGIGQYDRPQSIEFSPDGSEIYIADACNHRIVVTDIDGNVLRMFGAAGTGPGQLHYPYGFAFLDDGTIMVAEFGNNRLQRFTADGTPLGLFGRLGAGEGEVRYPWKVAAYGGVVYVLDSGNNRVQIISAL